MKNIYKINELLLVLFNTVLDTDAVSSSPEIVQELSLFIAPNATYAKTAIKKHAKSLNLDKINKTFYKEWGDIENATFGQLLLDQMKHYSDTYGTEFTKEEVYIPNEAFGLKTEGGFKIRVIAASTIEDITSSVENLLYSGIAMSEDTITQLLELVKQLSINIDINSVKNREALTRICVEQGIYPANADDALRVIKYEITGSTNAVKRHNASITACYDITHKPKKDTFKKAGLKNLSTVFNRNKAFFLAVKKAFPEFASDINKISRLSKKYHVPQAVNPLSVATSTIITNSNSHWLEKATIYNLFRAYNACYNTSKRETNARLYHIRNGKSFAVEKEAGDIGACITNMGIIEKEIKKRLSHLVGKSVYIPDNVEYGLPISEKKFVGKFPYGTRFSNENAFNVGVYWENSFGVWDLDLSGITTDGEYYGFCGNRHDKDITYSGDITRAPEGAVEYLRIKKTTSVHGMLVSANGFNSSNEWKCNIILGTYDQDYGRMMKPENLIFSAEYNAVGKGAILGVFYKHNDKLWFSISPSVISNSQIGRVTEVMTTARTAMIDNAKYSVSLGDVLSKIGCYLVETPEESDLDLSIDKLTVSTFTDMFSGN